MGGVTWQSLAFVFVLAVALDSHVVGMLTERPDWLRSLGMLLSWPGRGDLIGMALVLLVVFFMVRLLVSRCRIVRAQCVLGLKVCALVFFAVILSGFAVHVLKVVIGRARPMYFEEFGAFHFQPLVFLNSYKSFPSAHATTLGALTIIAIWSRPAWQSLWWTIAVSAALGRVLAGEHFPSDVVAGFTLGGGVTLALIWVLGFPAVLPANADP